MKTLTLLLIVITGLVSTTLQASQAIEQLQERYRNNGAAFFEALDGKALWYSDQNGRSCASCHGSSPAVDGKHWKTGKKIMPMALSVNPQRLTKTSTIEKWFLRNCKWTLGRECSPQEKGNILQWLKQL